MGCWPEAVELKEGRGSGRPDALQLHLRSRSASASGCLWEWAAVPAVVAARRLQACQLVLPVVVLLVLLLRGTWMGAAEGNMSWME